MASARTTLLALAMGAATLTAASPSQTTLESRVHASDSLDTYYGRIVQDAFKQSKDSDVLLIDKAGRKAYLLHDAQADTTYRIALGPDPIGDKVYVGDGRTPEGIYHVTWKRDGTPGNTSTFGLAFLLDYPLPTDRKEFTRAKAAGLTPEGVTGPGGHIEVHSGPDRRDWTLGCISIKEEGMQHLMRHLENKSMVAIVGYVPETQDYHVELRTTR
ncbi:MAG: L,D-transpeptidase family protein [Nanoarchaeota archaeon]